MKISATETVGGVPVLRVRWMLRKADGSVSVSFAAGLLEIQDQVAEDLIRTLEHRGYLNKDASDSERWETTVKGNAFTMASAARSLTRAAAERSLLEFLARVDQVNCDPQWCFKIERVVLFGSLLTDAQRVNDVDVAIILEPRHAGHAQHEAKERRRQDAANAGRRFGNIGERLCWPEHEIRLFLKDRKRISIHDLQADRPIIEAAAHVTVYQNGVICRDALPMLQEWTAEGAKDRYVRAVHANQVKAARRRVAALAKDEASLREINSKLAGFLQMSPDELRARGDEVQEILDLARVVKLRGELEDRSETESLEPPLHSARRS